MPNRLDDEPFAYQVGKEDKVMLLYQGKVVRTLSAERARQFLAEIEEAGDSEAQLMMAKLTGNFKRGNEKQSAKRSHK